MRQLRNLLWHFTLTPLLFFSVAALAAEKPNIVLVVADDLGWKDVGYNGAAFYETPNIDRLAGDGMAFSRFYPGAANCAPARATFLSGMYSPRHHVYLPQGGSRVGENTKMRLETPLRGQEASFDAFQVNVNHLAPEFETLAEVLGEAGYATARIGKWHIGDDNQGFGFVSSNGVPGHVTNVGGVEERFYKDIHVAERMTDLALSFIEENRDGPFFLYLAHWEVHNPMAARQERIEYFDKKNEGRGENWNPVYAAEVEQVDLSVGRIRAKLEELSLVENTVVIFTSDNGGLPGRTSNRPLRAGKGTFYEGGIRVPFVLSWPGVIRPGSEADVPVNGVDLMPTLAEMASAKLPQGQPVDGVSLVPALNGGAVERETPLFFHFPLYLGGSGNGDVLPAFDGTQDYWLAVPSTTVIQGDWKLIYYYEYERYELFNLKDDISEQNDLAEKEVARAEDMLRELRAWVDRVGAPVPAASET